MSNCKNCKYTDEYCASGDCNRIQANDLACNKISLTEQWKKGELPEGHYYVKDGENMIAEYLDGYFYNDGNPMTSFNGGVDSVLDKVPSYEEWQALNQNLDSTMQTNKALYKELAEIKELLRIILSKIKICYSMVFQKDIINAELNEALLKKIKEVLKCGNIK